MHHDTFVDMITAICMSHRSNFSDYEGDALDGNGNLNEEYYIGVSHVIACMIAQRLDCSVDTLEPAQELLLHRIKNLSLDAQRSMVDEFVRSFG